MFRRILIGMVTAVSLISASSALAGVTNWLPFEIQDGHITVPITLAGQPSRAILDTGAEMNGINAAFMQQYSPDLTEVGQTEIQGAFGKEFRQHYNAVPVNIFGVELELDKMVELNLGDVENGIILGAGFFDDFIVQIDYPNQRMRLFTKDSIDMSKVRNIRSEVDKSSWMPIVKVRLNDERDVWLLLDTGSNGGLLLERRIAQSKGWLDTFETQMANAQGVNESQAVEYFQIPSLEFGPFELENVTVSVPAEGMDITLNNQVGASVQTGSRIKGKRVDGLLGYDVLKHFVITMDYEDSYIHIGLPEEVTASN